MYYYNSIVENPESKDALLKRELNVTLIGLIVNWTETNGALRLTVKPSACKTNLSPTLLPSYGKSVMKTFASDSISLNANLFHSGGGKSLLQVPLS